MSIAIIRRGVRQEGSAKTLAVAARTLRNRRKAKLTLELPTEITAELRRRNEEGEIDLSFMGTRAVEEITASHPMADSQPKQTDPSES